MFHDRSHAGRLLAQALEDMADSDNLLVLGLPRGGVPVAFEVARKLGASLDVCLVRKLGLPGWEELAMGAIASGGIRVLNPDVTETYGIEADVLEAVTAREKRELERRERRYRPGRPSLDVRGRTVVLVDDGLATGSTMKAAIAALRAQKPARIVVAVPVGPRETLIEIRQKADKVVCLATPQEFEGVGQFYDRFDQITDEQVLDLLERSRTQSLGLRDAV